MAAAHYLCLCLAFGTFILSEGKLEKRQILSVCSVDTFNCTNGSCIDSSLICDGRKDCPDGSDETQNLCANQTCPSYVFQCKYGACVPKVAKCNGKDDCADGSDEKLIECLKGSSSATHTKPNCQPDEYRCKSGQCIDDASTCDGTRDCGDGTDETLILCKNVACPKYSFKCKYGACISYTSRCDGVRQCIDGSDENHECTIAANPKPKPTTHATPPTVPPSTSSAGGRKPCELPNTEGSIYKYYDSNSNAVLHSKTKVAENSIIEESCEKEYYQNGSSRYIVCTKTGHWQQTNSDKLCLKKCPPMISDTLDITCTFKGEDVDCSKRSIPGTKLKPKCKVTHYLETGQERPTEHTCLTDGKWSGVLYTCVPYCGRLTYTKAEPQILLGSKAKFGTAPWNVAIYQTQNNSLICGGTLISPNLVVSAAHCFFDGEVTPESRKLLENENMYKIGVGKYDRNISIIDNDFTQIVNVGKIIIPDSYHGLTGNYDEDIAVIWLPTKVKIGALVAPACIDWSGKYTVQNGSPGKIVGWGNTEQMVPSSYLLEATMSYINQTACRKMYLNNFSVSGFQNFVTNDKFCANSESGQGVDKGDSGAGLTFAFNSLHHLTGVVSLKDTSIPGSTTAVFTDVGLHVNWLSNIYLNYSN